MRSRLFSIPKKFVSTPCTNRGSHCSFPAYYAIFVGWDALAKARRGKEKNRSKKRALLDRHLGVIILSRHNRTLHVCHLKYDMVALIPNGHLYHNLSKVILKVKVQKDDCGSTYLQFLFNMPKNYMYFYERIRQLNFNRLSRHT